MRLLGHFATMLPATYHSPLTTYCHLPLASVLQVRPLGYFATKVEAAICYAKWAREERRAMPEKMTGLPRERTHHPRSSEHGL